MKVRRARLAASPQFGAAAATWRLPLVSAAIVVAWLIAAFFQVTGNAAALHHHALIEGGPPLWIAVPLFVVGWQVMVAAMMLPASLTTLRVVQDRARRPGRRRFPTVAFIGGYAAVWTSFGLAAFFGDLVLHRLVDATPWLAARPWLIEAGVLALAGAYQFAPSKARFRAACRHPAAIVPEREPSAGGLFRQGLEHGIDCLGSSGALMLLMFAEGFANLWWMAVLTLVMTYEANGRHGPRVARIAGAVLVLAGVAVLSGPFEIGARSIP